MPRASIGVAVLIQSKGDEDRCRRFDRLSRIDTPDPTHFNRLMTMKFASPRVLLVGFLVAWFAVPKIHAQDLPASPKELNELAAKFLETRKREIDEPFAARRAQVDKSYLNALGQALQKASAEGDLETVLELRKETERVQKGEPFPGVAEYRRFKARELVETYGEYLAKSEAEKASLVSGMAAEFDKGLRTLLSDLTKQGRVDDAVAVKTFREGPEMKKLVPGGTTPAVAAAPGMTVTPSSASPAPNPLPVSTPEAVPTGPARLVIVPLAAGGIRHPVFESVAAADFQDVVFIGRSVFPNIGVVRADGSLVHWRGDGGTPEIVPGSATLCVQDHLLPLVGLNADGTLVSSATDDADLASRLKSENGITHIAASSGVLSVVRRDGSLAVLGPRFNVPTAGVMNGMANVSQVGFSGAAFSTVLKTDGTVIEIANGAPREQSRAEGVVKIHAHSVGGTRSGEVMSWGVFTGDVTNELGRNPRQVFAENRRFGGIRADGRVFLAKMDDAGKWQALDAVAKVLKGAYSFTWLYDDRSEWIAAVLPVDSVSRSGFWELEELAVVRN
jgi:hypothetical protein